MNRERIKIIAAIAALGIAGYFVWLLLPSLWSDDSNLLIRLLLVTSVVVCVLSARLLWRRIRD
jgi:hypothetical protein